MQPPQCRWFWDVRVSQPLPVLPSQSAVSGAQFDLQLPEEQFGADTGQLLPQVPQFLVSVVTFTSQPLPRALPSQSTNPLLQAIWHLPALQLGVPLLLLQVEPQPPQWVAVVLVLISQPFVGLASQFA